MPVAEAVDFYLRRHQGTILARPVPEVVVELLDSKRADNLSARYLKQLEYDLNRFGAKFGGRIGDVAGTEVDGWLRSLGLAPRTRNNLRASVATLFAFARGRKYLPKDHDELEAVPVAKDADGEIEIFTPAEMSELLLAASPRLLPFLAIAAFAGVRHAELQRLDWADVKRDGDIIEIRPGKAKTGSRRVIPILPNLKAWLEPHWQETGPVCGYVNMTIQFEELTRRVNEERARQATGRGGPARVAPRSPERGDGAAAAEFKWKHNALRHSFISYRVAQIQNVAQVALEAGNSPQMIFKHYRELVRPKEAEAWFAIVPEKPGNVVELKRAA